mmetsp:Transcript_50723/g.75826  ORF Transcript_50723/g.75826 Transcript_50723/m.75826 type:complete len:172 (-) Transcript_50723:842-1357(-)
MIRNVPPIISTRYSIHPTAQPTAQPTTLCIQCPVIPKMSFFESSGFGALSFGFGFMQFLCSQQSLQSKVQGANILLLLPINAVQMAMGNVPESAVCSKSKNVSLLSLVIAAGIVPVNSDIPENCNESRFVNNPISDGMVPVYAKPWIERVSKFVRRPSSVESVPVMADGAM